LQSLRLVYVFRPRLLSLAIGGDKGRQHFVNGATFLTWYKSG